MNGSTAVRPYVNRGNDTSVVAPSETLESLLTGNGQTIDQMEALSCAMSDHMLGSRPANASEISKNQEGLISVVERQRSQLSRIMIELQNMAKRTGVRF